uniref:Uncharacterized protein n=1 Tax=Saimiri boliviensis boliviensis TaxID=39432 RepID=A0A2K6V091_SAIBB
MLLLAVSYRFHYCRSVQSNGGGGKERRDESFLFTDLSTCLFLQEIFVKEAVEIAKFMQRTERIFENLSPQNKTKC